MVRAAGRSPNVLPWRGCSKALAPMSVLTRPVQGRADVNSASTPTNLMNAPCLRRSNIRSAVNVGISPDPRCFPADPRCTEANAKWIRLSAQQAKDARDKFGMFPPERCRSELIRAAGTPKRPKRTHGDDDSAETPDETPTKRRRAPAEPDQPLQLTKNGLTNLFRKVSNIREELAIMAAELEKFEDDIEAARDNLRV